MAGNSEYNQVKIKVYELLTDIVGISAGEINEHTPWYDLEAESFELVEFIVAVREAFNVRISTRDLMSMKNLHDIIEFIISNRSR